MDHTRYLLTMFFTEDETFFNYISKQDDETSIDDIYNIKNHLNFLLMILIKAKDKLEAIGYSYEPLSEEYVACLDFSNTKELRVLHNRIPINVNKQPIIIDRGYLADFVFSLIRYKKESNNIKIPTVTRYIDPRKDIQFLNILNILHDNKTFITK
nr:virion assembly protein [Wadden Sea poxvirus]